MIENIEFLDWLTLEEGKPVKIAVLAQLIARSLYPGDEDEAAYRVEREVLDDDLQKAVQIAPPMNLTSSSPDRYKLELVDVPLNAEIIPGPDLERFLNMRRIGLRLIAPVNDGPVYWTLQNAALAIQKQEGWCVHTRDGFLLALGKAACRKELVVRDPRTGIIDEIEGPLMSSVHTVTDADVNNWLEKQGVPYRWNIASPTPTEGVGNNVLLNDSVSPKSDEPLPLQTLDAVPTTTDISGPLPLTTSDIAHYFAGLKWTEVKLKKLLGNKPKWLSDCIVTPGNRGRSEILWNPVYVGAALIRHINVTPSRVRAIFKNEDNKMLHPWLEAWKNYEFDYLDK